MVEEDSELGLGGRSGRVKFHRTSSPSFLTADHPIPFTAIAGIR